MIEIHFIKGRHWPLVLCDACRERITDCHKAHILWNGDIESGPVYHVHKGACNRAIEQKIRDDGGHDFWDSLDEHLVGVCSGYV
jgi:hypothetical protein